MHLRTVAIDDGALTYIEASCCEWGYRNRL